MEIAEGGGEVDGGKERRGKERKAGGNGEGKRGGRWREEGEKAAKDYLVIN